MFVTILPTLATAKRKRNSIRADLSVIRENLEEMDPKPHYENKQRMRIDLNLMIENCKKYNAEDTEFWAAADALEKFIAEVYSRKP